MSEGVRKNPKLLRDPAKEGQYATEVDQKGENQEGYKEEGKAFTCNCYVTVMIIICHTIYFYFY